MTALRALVIDDDVDAAEWLAYTLQSRFPELRIETRLTPDVSGEYDLYFIDNDFHGESMAGDLAHSIRDLNPNGLIVAFSARLDGRTLKRLVNAGCDGAFDKSSPEEVNHLLAIVDKYMAQSKAHSQERGFLGAIRAIRGLLSEWNRRLELDPWKAPAPEVAEAAAR